MKKLFLLAMIVLGTGLAQAQDGVSIEKSKMEAKMEKKGAKMEAKFQKKLRRKLGMQSIHRVFENNHQIAKNKGVILSRVASMEKRIASAKADIGKKTIAQKGNRRMGWIFQGAKSQAKKDARIAKDIARNEAVLAKYMISNAAMRRIANDQKDLDQIEALKQLIN